MEAITSISNANAGILAVTSLDRAPSSEEAATSVTTSPTAFSQNIDRFKELATTVLDTSGKYSDDERTQAYSSLFETGVKAQLRGMDTDSRKLYDQATIGSDIAQRAQQLQQQDVAAVTTAVAAGGDAHTAKLKVVAGLSEADQKTHFAVNENSFSLAGSRQYADFDAYRNQLVANASRSAGDAQLADGLKPMDSKTSGDSWNERILALFSGKSVSGSDSEQTSKPSVSKSSLPAAYQPGSVYDETA